MMVYDLYGESIFSISVHFSPGCELLATVADSSLAATPHEMVLLKESGRSHRTITLLSTSLTKSGSHWTMRWCCQNAGEENALANRKKLSSKSKVYYKFFCNMGLKSLKNFASSDRTCMHKLEFRRHKKTFKIHYFYGLW